MGRAADKRNRLPNGVYWLVYDAENPGGALLCRKPLTHSFSGVLADSEKTTWYQTDRACQPWQAATQFFESGSFLRLQVVNGRLESSFNVNVNGTALSDNVPLIRGLTAATQAQSPPAQAATPSGGAAPPALKSDIAAREKDLRDAYNNAWVSIEAIYSYTGDLQHLDGDNQSGCAVPAQLYVPGSTLAEAVRYARTMNSLAKQCKDQGPPAAGSTVEKLFDYLSDRTSRLVDAVNLLNSSLAASKALSDPGAAMTAANGAWNTYAGIAGVCPADGRKRIRLHPNRRNHLRFRFQLYMLAISALDQDARADSGH
jgi:hypothetical protein